MMKIRTALQTACLCLTLAVSSQAISQQKDAAPGTAKSASAAKAQGSGTLGKQDAQRLADLARSDLAEVAAGKLASSKAASADVRQYAQHMVDEHGKMLKEGGELAKSRGIEPPSAPAAKHQAALKKLEGLSGAAFDRAYMQQMVADHQEALRLVKGVASKADDAGLKALAAKAVPKVEEHLAKATQLAKSKS